MALAPRVENDSRPRKQRVVLVLVVVSPPEISNIEGGQQINRQGDVDHPVSTHLQTDLVTTTPPFMRSSVCSYTTACLCLVTWA